MGGVEDRVREFLNSRKMQDSSFKAIDPEPETELHCCECGTGLADGAFVMISGKPYCLECHLHLEV
jgi:hypothetical protein